MANEGSYELKTPFAVDHAALAIIGENEARAALPQENSSMEADAISAYSKRLQAELQTIGLIVKRHEKNINVLKAEINRIDESILDNQVILAKLHSSSTTVHRNEEETTAQLLRHERSAAGILCYLNSRHGTVGLQFTKDVLGVVANLGTVDDENLSRLLSEYLGVDTMMSIVCRTHEGVRVLETYQEDGTMNNTSGLHGLAASIGRRLEGRFNVICLEYLRPCVGEVVRDDPQRRLDLHKPKLQNGECPHGFLGFAVNMINVDSTNLCWLTPSGYGLRETLFYSLLSRVQVYKTRADMLEALSCITDGAISLDGGMIKSGGIFYLGNGAEVSIKFPVSPQVSALHGGYADVENEIKKMKWIKGTILGDLQRERQLLELGRADYERKKQEYIKFIADSSPCLNQHQYPAAQPWTPGYSGLI